MCASSFFAILRCAGGEDGADITARESGEKQVEIDARAVATDGGQSQGAWHPFRHASEGWHLVRPDWGDPSLRWGNAVFMTARVPLSRHASAGWHLVRPDRGDPSLRWGDAVFMTARVPLSRHASAGWHLVRPGRGDPSLRWGDVECNAYPFPSCQRRLASLAPSSNIWTMAKGGWTYIMTNRPRGVLYVGVTSDLAARVHQHRLGLGSDFCKRYKLNRLVLAEPHATILEAIAREKALKAWQRAWKLRLIEEANPNWEDLSAHILSGLP